MLSLEHDAKVSPSGEKATEFRLPEWPSNVCKVVLQASITAGSGRIYFGISPRNVPLMTLCAGANASPEQ